MVKQREMDNLENIVDMFSWPISCGTRAHVSGGQGLWLSSNSGMSSFPSGGSGCGNLWTREVDELTVIPGHDRDYYGCLGSCFPPVRCGWRIVYFCHHSLGDTQWLDTIGIYLGEGVTRRTG